MYKIVGKLAELGIRIRFLASEDNFATPAGCLCLSAMMDYFVLYAAHRLIHLSSYGKLRKDTFCTAWLAIGTDTKGRKLSRVTVSHIEC